MTHRFVNLYMYKHVNMDLFFCTCICTSMCIYAICSSVRAYTHRCVYMCTRARSNTLCHIATHCDIHVYKYIFTLGRVAMTQGTTLKHTGTTLHHTAAHCDTHVYMYVPMNAYTFISMYMYICVCIYIRKHIYIYTGTSQGSRRLTSE